MLGSLCTLTWPHIVRRRGLSYVARARQLQRLKEEDAFCTSQLSVSQFLLYSKGRPLLQADGRRPLWLSFEQTTRLAQQLEKSCVLLDVTTDGSPQLAVNAGAELDRSAVEDEVGGRFTDLRLCLFLVEAVVAACLTRGWSLLQWKSSLNFCSKCGQPIAGNISGSHAKCRACSSVFYPSVTSPVGIVSICDPTTDQMLLIRQPRYPAGMYSCIAGFVDAGESLEECVKREAAEEVGIEVQKVAYVASQHWPFPAGSLMIGCQAEALPGQLPDPCKLELEDARWFTRPQVTEAFERIKKNPGLRLGGGNDPTKIFVPPRGAIANYLIKNWLEQPRLS